MPLTDVSLAQVPEEQNLCRTHPGSLCQAAGLEWSSHAFFFIHTVVFKDTVVTMFKHQCAYGVQFSYSLGKSNLVTVVLYLLRIAMVGNKWPICVYFFPLNSPFPLPIVTPDLWPFCSLLCLDPVPVPKHTVVTCCVAALTPPLFK